MTREDALRAYCEAYELAFEMMTRSPLVDQFGRPIMSRAVKIGDTILAKRPLRFLIPRSEA